MATISLVTIRSQCLILWGEKLNCIGILQRMITSEVDLDPCNVIQIAQLLVTW